MEPEKDGDGLAVTGETTDARAALVHRRFKRARRNAMGRGFWEHWRPGDCALIVGMCSTILILFLEPALWSDIWPAGLIKVRVPDGLVAILLVILPLNGWLIDRFLSSKTPGEAALPRWLLGLRCLLGSLPLIGLYLTSLWRWILERKPLTRLPKPVCLDLLRERPRLPAGIRSRAFYRSSFFLVWMATSFLPLLVWAVWLAQTTALGPYHRAVIFGACALLHLVAGAFMAQYFRQEIRNASLRGWRRALFLIAPVLWVLTLPGMVLGLALFLFADPSHTSLTWRAHASRTAVGRDPLWKNIESVVRRQWRERPWFAQWRRPEGLVRPERAGQVAANVIAFYRLKALLLALDGTALFGAVLKTTQNAVFLQLWWTVAALAGLGLVIQGIALAARLIRVSGIGEALNRHPYGRYLLLTQMALLAGLCGAVLYTAGQIQELGLLLCYGGALCGVFAVLFLLLPTGSSSPNGPDMTLWAGLFLCVCAWGGLIALDGESSQPSLVALEILAALTPLWSLGLFLALGGWLLRPFSWRHVADAGLPLRFRAALLLLILTAALPLGGLAAPFWIYVRHRLWSRYERRGEQAVVSKM